MQSMIGENGINESSALEKELRRDFKELMDQVLLNVAEEEKAILANVSSKKFKSSRKDGAPPISGAEISTFLSEMRRQEAISLVDSWLEDTSGYDGRVWPKLSREIERNRLSDRDRLDG